ncbi:hypothetical protein MNV84_00017 [Leishmania braziliensis]|nr:hypothetical protein MNV84_00017 [Leishmania braziliensis]
MHHYSMEHSPDSHPVRLSPPLSLFPLRKITEWCKVAWTKVRGVKKAECTSDEPATDEARPAPEVVPLRPVGGPSDSRCETRPVPRPVPRPLPIPPPLRMLPPPEERLPCERRVTAARAHKRVTWASDVPATDAARPAPEVVPLRPVGGPSDSRCETRPVPRPVPRPLPIPPPLRMLPPPEERLPCERRVTAARAHKRVTWASDVPATDEARPAPEVVPLRPVSGPSDSRCETRPVPRPLPIPPPLRMLPPPEERLPCERRVTAARAHKRVTWASDVPATDAARPAPEVVPLRPVGGPSDARCETRPVPRPLPIPPPLRMLPPPEERLPCERRVTAARAHRRVKRIRAESATDEAPSAPEVVPLRPVGGPSDARCETRPVPRPLPIPPPLRMLPPPEERLPCERRVTAARAYRRVKRIRAEPATDEAPPTPEVVPLRPVGGPSGTRCRRRRGSRPLCGCKKQRTDRGSRLGGARLGRYGRAIFSAAEIRFRERQRRELGIERFRRVGLCTEESDAGTLQPSDVLPRTDADAASDVASDAGTLRPGDVLPRTDADAAAGVASAVAKPIPLRPVSGPSGTRCRRRRGSRPLCRCKKQRTSGVKRRRVRRRRYRGRRIMCTEGSHCRDRRVPFILARLLRDTLSSEASGAAMLPHSHCPLCAQLDQAFAALSLDEEEPLPPLPTSYIHCLPPIVAYTFTGVDAARTPSVSLFRF